MIISRTPLRLSFFGGGTDYPQYYLEHGGAVLATTINKYCYVCLHEGKSSVFFDLPTKSGLGSSSAYTVGLLRVCTVLDRMVIAQLATLWERDKMGGNIGSQDQYMCAMGGFRHLRFDDSGIRDNELPYELVKPLEDYLLLFDTHQRRRAGDVVAKQLAQVNQNEKLLVNMKSMVNEGLSCIRNSDYKSFGALLDAAWQMKKQLADNVTTPEIDLIYDSARTAGAIGGKLLGAGGGGFIVFFVEPDKHESVRSVLKNLTCAEFRFEREGTKVIYSD